MVLLKKTKPNQTNTKKKTQQHRPNAIKSTKNTKWKQKLVHGFSRKAHQIDGYTCIYNGLYCIYLFLSANKRVLRLRHKNKRITCILGTTTTKTSICIRILKFCILLTIKCCIVYFVFFFLLIVSLFFSWLFFLDLDSLQLNFLHSFGYLL